MADILLDNLVGAEPEPGPFRKGISAGVAGVKASGYGLKAFGARLIGAQDAEAQAIADAKAVEEQAAPSNMDYRDVTGVGSAFDWAKFALGSALPSIAVSLVGGAGGRVAGAALGKNVVEQGARAMLKDAGFLTGAGATSFGLETGGIFPEAVEEKVGAPAARAAAGGAVNALLDTAFPALLLKNLGEKAARQAGLGAVLKGAAAGGAKAITAEGGTEAAQEAVSMVAAGLDPTASEGVHRMLTAGLTGAVAGGGIGIPSAALSTYMRPIEGPAPQVAPPPAAAPVPPAAPPVAPIVEPPAPLPVLNELVANRYDDVANTPLPTLDTRPLTEPGAVVDPYRRAESPVAAEADALRFEGLRGQFDALRSQVADIDARLQTAGISRRDKALLGRKRAEAQREMDAVAPQVEQLRQVMNNRQALAEAPQYQPKGGQFTEPLIGTTELDKNAPVQTAVQAVQDQAIDSKISRGELLTTSEANRNRQRQREAAAAAPAVVPVQEQTEGQPREVVKSIPVQERQQAMRETIRSEMARELPVLGKEAPASKRTALEKSVAALADKAAAAPTLDAALAIVRDEGPKLIRPHVKSKLIADNIAENIAQKVSQSPDVPLYSRGAAQSPVINFTHWGDATTQLDPARIGTGVPGEDQALAREVGLTYSSAVVKGSSYTEPAVQGRPQREGTLRADSVYQARSDDPILLKAKADLNARGIYNDRLAWMQYTKAVKDLGYDAMQYANGQLRIFTPQTLRTAVVNVGLNVGDKANALSVTDVKAAVSQLGVEPVDVSVHRSATENTAVVSLSRPLTDVEIHRLAELTKQEAVAQWDGSTGSLQGPKATNWGSFNPDFFLTHSGQTLTAQPSNAAILQDDGTGRPTQESYDQYQLAQTASGQRMIAELQRLLGVDPNLEVKLFLAQPGEPIGSYTRTQPYKDVISLALNAKEDLSVANHEGFHYIEKRLLTDRERAIVRSALREGSALFKQVIAKTRAYDLANGTNITDEVLSKPAEAHAYGFEFWQRGELQPEGPLATVFQKIRNFLEKVLNFIQGQGFTSIEDVFHAIDRGEMAQRLRRADSEQGTFASEARAVAASAGWTPERVRRLLSTYGYQDGRSKAYAVMMSPTQFLNLTTSPRSRGIIEEESRPLNIEQLAGESQEIYLNVSPRSTQPGDVNDRNFSIRGHEGRHRMEALRRAGVTAVSVTLNLGHGQTLQDVASAFIHPQDFIETRGTAGANVQQLIPITYENRARLEAMGAPSQIQFSQEAANKWYRSALTEQVAALNMKAASAQGWKDQIKGLVAKGLVKQAEIEAVGLNEWLDLQTGKVTKDQVSQFLRENGVQVEETVLGEGILTPEEKLELRDLSIKQVERGLTLGESLRYKQLSTPEYESLTKFETYQLPGGENYRELLLRLPEKEPSFELDSYIEHLNKKYGTEVDRLGAITPGWDVADIQPFELAQLRELQAARNREKAGSFNSSHFDQPNILAHVRFNERTDADGKRVLFIEEIQSDWAQKGKREGFKGQRKATDADMASRGANDLDFTDAGVPDAPFVKKTEAWVGLAMKRMIRYAVENGFDKVAWTTGEQQAARYDLSKQIDTIAYYKDGTGWHVSANRLGAEVLRKDGLTDSGVEELVGKEILSRMKESKGDVRRHPEEDGTFRELSGVDLKIGGEGMKAFYDKIVPSVANDVLKKLGGGKVGTSQLPGTKNTEREAEYNDSYHPIRGNDGQYYLVDGDGAPYDNSAFPTAAAANAYLNTQLGRQVGAKAELGEQPSFDITPAMRDKAIAGLPLFSRGAVTPAEGAAATDSKRQEEGGELERQQQMDAIASILDNTKQTYSGVFKAFPTRLSESFRKARLQIASNMRVALDSSGFKNVLQVLTGQSQRKESLIAQTIEVGLSEYLAPSTTDTDIQTVGDVLRQRDKQGYLATSQEYRDAMAPLSTKQKRMFEQATNMIADTLRKEFIAEQPSYMDALATDLVRANLVDKAAVLRAISIEAAQDKQAALAGLTPEQQQLFEDAKDYREWFTNRSTWIATNTAAGWMPHRRYGDYIVHIYRPTPGNLKGERLTLYSEHFENKGLATEAANRYASGLVGTNPDLKVEIADKYQADRDTGNNFQKFIDTAQRFGIQLSYDERSRLAKALIHADSLQRSRIFKRNWVPGESKDTMRVLAEHGTLYANKIAYLEFSPYVQDALRGFPVTVTNDKGQFTLNTDRRSILWETPGERAQSGQYKNMADQLVDNLHSPHPGSEWTQRIASYSVLHFLGASFATAVSNLTSLPLLTVPWLSAHTDYTNAAAKMGAAFTLTMKNQAILRDIAKLRDRSVAIPDIDSQPGLRDFLIQASQDSTTLDTELRQITGLTRGDLLSRSRKVQKAVELWMLPFRFSEQVNRTAAFIAAYKIGRENNLAGAALYKFAQEAVHNTQFRYDEVNRPALLHNPVWRLLFTFKTFPLYTIEMLETLWRNGNRAAVVTMLTGLAITAGVEGLPFAEDILDLIDVVSQRLFNSPFNLRRAMRNQVKQASEALIGLDASELFMRGILNTATGLNIASRIGSGDIVPGTRIGAADTDYARMAESVLGPVGALGVSALGAAAATAKGATRAIDGDFTGSKAAFMGIMRDNAPIAVRNLYKGVEQFSQGFASDAQGRKLADVSGWEAAWQGAGFSSANVAKMYELDRIDKQSNAFYRQVRDDFSNGIVKAMRDGNSERAQDLMNMVQKWNGLHPEMPIGFDPAIMRRNIAMAGMPLNERTLRMLPKQLRGTSVAGEGSLGQ